MNSPEFLIVRCWAVAFQHPVTRVNYIARGGLFNQKKIVHGVIDCVGTWHTIDDIKALKDLRASNDTEKSLYPINTL
jgi:hypothetical protein